MSEFFREVDEDVRRDRIIRIWTQYRYVLIGLAVLMVAGTGAWHVYEQHRGQAGEAAGTKFEAAVQLAHDGKSAEAVAAFEALGKTAPKGYATLARLRAADELAASSDPEAAIKAYEALAEDQSFDPTFRDFAKLRAAMLRVDNDDPLDFEKGYVPLASDIFPYHDQIRELLGLAALKRKAFESAGRWFNMIISDPRAPAGLRMRAEALMGLVKSSFVPTEQPPPASAQDGNPPPGNPPAK
jgi:hypothetical protein